MFKFKIFLEFDYFKGTVNVISIKKLYVELHFLYTTVPFKTLPELKTFEWDILNPDRIINLEIKNERRTSNI